ncbi:hypothetical protein [Cohaesibacter gelatinilyticus]|uniref:Uncharacterized protein n=1 Tax=Cohaesibacter gelatinilyticus TaxID=372072 RepID=A0A285PIS2_9HYPH|nr:hypothetical protein [Cohaesibacter gelatinilyticus]SNZ21328.1 hypothetical protein SAMN06265368_4445 [Cohaesibacter gelatinilyticus]
MSRTTNEGQLGLVIALLSLIFAIAIVIVVGSVVAFVVALFMLGLADEQYRKKIKLVIIFSAFFVALPFFYLVGSFVAELKNYDEVLFNLGFASLMSSLIGIPSVAVIIAVLIMDRKNEEKGLPTWKARYKAWQERRGFRPKQEASELTEPQDGTVSAAFDVPPQRG